MAAEGTPLETLPAWAALNDLDFFDVKVATTPSRGQGLVAERTLSRLEDTFDIPTLLRIPNKLVLSAETVELYAKVDGNFKQLLDSAGQKVNLRRKRFVAILITSNNSISSHNEAIYYCFCSHIWYYPLAARLPRARVSRPHGPSI